jgi:predicted nucleotidyltransferase
MSQFTGSLLVVCNNLGRVKNPDLSNQPSRRIEKLMITLDDLLQQREKILTIAQRHGAFNVRIFGSVARGEARDRSDVDFLVDYNRSRRSSWFPMGLIEDLEALLGVRVDVVTEKSLKSRLRDRVLQEAKPL